MKKKHPPRPSFTYHLSTLGLDRPSFFSELANDYGDFIRIPSFGKNFLARHPDLVKEILVTHSDTIDREGIYVKPLVVAFGDGLLILKGKIWQERRKKFAPPFQPKHIEHHSESIACITREFIQQWRKYENANIPFDITEEMMILVLTITVKLIFSVILTYEEAKKITTIIKNENHYALSLLSFFPKISAILYPSRLKKRDLVKQFLMKVFQEHREKNFDADLATIMLDAQKELQFSESDLLSEALTFLATGHETTGAALSWYWYLLGLHPEYYARTKEEVLKTCVGDINHEISKQLEFVAAGFDETLRLYPPIWINARYTNIDHEILGYTIPAKSNLIVCSYALHRHPEFWSEPEVFNPNRFLESEKHKIIRYSYIPFGAGPRVCIASSFALQQAQIMIATILQHCDLELVPNQSIEMMPLISLKPKKEIWMKVKFPS